MWFAENKYVLSEKEGTTDETTIQSVGLQQWRAMTKIEKEIFKEARIPNVRNTSAENKKRELSVLNEGNESDAVDSKTSNKLARFSAPE